MNGVTPLDAGRALFTLVITARLVPRRWLHEPQIIECEFSLFSAMLGRAGQTGIVKSSSQFAVIFFADLEQGRGCGYVDLLGGDVAELE